MKRIELNLLFNFFDGDGVFSSEAFAAVRLPRILSPDLATGGAESYVVSI